MLLMLCGCLAAVAQADLAITNGDFEADATQTINVTDWYDTVTTNVNNWWETTWAGPNVSPTGTPVLGLSYMFTTTNWAYQSLGTNDANWEGMTVTYDVGSFTDAGGPRDLGVTVSVYESDGTFTPADNTDIDGAAGITLIDSVSTLYPSVAVGAYLTDTITLDLRAAGSGEIFLRLENFAGTTGEPWTAIDNIEIASVSFAFDYDSPDPGADNIAIELTSPENDLVFTINDADIEKVDVQFGVENDPNLTDKAAYKIVDGMAVTTGQYTVDLVGELAANLLYDTPYYWKVIGYEPNTLPGATDFFAIPGPVAFFTTLPEEPEVTPVSPAFIAVDAGTASVVLSVTGSNVTSYEWYKVGNPTALSDDDVNYSIETIGKISELTILDVQSGDEGYYYCYVENSVGNATSDPGRVMTRRQTSYYPFETTTVVDGNDVTPDTVGGFDAVLLAEGGEAPPALADANQLDPSLGYYLELDNADGDPNGQYAQIPAGVVDYEDLTISVWVYPRGGSNWGRLFDFGSTDNDYLFLAPDNGAGSLHFAITTAGIGGEQVMTTTWLPWGFWSYVTVTLSGDTGRLYVNGELVTTNTSTTIDPLDVGAVLNYIGKSQFDVDPEFNGLIDDLKIYNYARTTEQVAQDYLDVRGEYVCNNEVEALVYDFNDDCLTNLEDFAMFAMEWLDTNRIYPD